MAYLDEYKPQKPFGIDLNYEFNTYKYIGRDYKEKNMLLGAVKFLGRNEIRIVLGIIHVKLFRNGKNTCES